MYYFYRDVWKFIKPHIIRVITDEIVQYDAKLKIFYPNSQVLFYIEKYVEKNKLADPNNKRRIRTRCDPLSKVFSGPQEFVINRFGDIWQFLRPHLIHVKKEQYDEKMKNNSQVLLGLNEIVFKCSFSLFLIINVAAGGSNSTK
uniref:uncharacterized protein LOC120330854 n=1 Tax=Styela clava TaxID=7725 RepID=UPI00193AA6AD|nr:uncharacterized protein LOC120330854 [Styela clava]